MHRAIPVLAGLALGVLTKALVFEWPLPRLGTGRVGTWVSNRPEGIQFVPDSAQEVSVEAPLGTTFDIIITLAFGGLPGNHPLLRRPYKLSIMYWRNDQSTPTTWEVLPTHLVTLTGIRRARFLLMHDEADYL